MIFSKCKARNNEITLDISYDSFCEIVQYLDFFQYNRLACVCRSFANNFTREEFWEKICFKHFNITYRHEVLSYFEIYKRMCLFLNFDQPITFKGQVEGFTIISRSSYGFFDAKDLSKWEILFYKEGRAFTIKGNTIKDLKTLANITKGSFDDSPIRINNKTYLLTIDLEHFSIDLNDLSGNTFQLKMYGWNKRVPLSLLPPKSSCIIS